MRLYLLVLLVFVTLLSCNDKQDSKKAIAIEKQNLEWAKGIVWYQIFPERFRNGLSTNDPTAAEVTGADLQPGWQPHPWNSDWYKIQPWEKKKSNKFYDVVFERRYGGDLIGVIEKLDYLQELGINGIYFNPVFEAQSLHKYDGATYHHIDDNFGENPQQDRMRLAAANETDKPQSWVWTSADSTFLTLIKEAHKRDIKVVIDGVFNHTGPEFFAFKDVVEKGPESIYADWYDIKKWDDPNTPENEFDFAGWWGFKGLPEFYEDENGFRPAVWQYIFAATERWMDPNGDGDPSDGIDGWRLDVADQVAPKFWREWYKHVKKINPKALIVAEIWNDASEAVKDSRFDGAMNYPFAYMMLDFFIHDKKRISGYKLAGRMDTLQQNYGNQTMQLLWNLIDSHDTDRMASMILNPDLNYDRMRSLRDNNDYVLRKPSDEERKVQKLIAAFQMTSIGAPMIYYGTEAGMWGDDDPNDRKPMLWNDISFENESTHPIHGKKRPSDVNKFDENLFSYYRLLINFRKKMPALKSGSFNVWKEVTSEDTFGFIRQKDRFKLFIVFNRSKVEQRITISLNHPLINVFNREELKVKNGKVEVVIPAQSFMVYK